MSIEFTSIYQESSDLFFNYIELIKKHISSMKERIDQRIAGMYDREQYVEDCLLYHDESTDVLIHTIEEMKVAPYIIVSAFHLDVVKYFLDRAKLTDHDILGIKRWTTDPKPGVSDYVRKKYNW